MTTRRTEAVSVEDVDERLAPLLTAHARHAVYTDLVRELDEAMDLACIGEPTIVVCLGPAGIGKSHLIRELSGRTGPGPRHQPAICVEAPPPSGRFAAITGTVEKALETLKEPLDKQLIEPDLPEAFRVITRELGTTHAARLLSLTRLIEILRPPLLAVDEAHNYALSPDRAKTVTVRTLKWFCDQNGGTPVVLFATYAFLDLFRGLEPDLVRRFDLHEFRRYRLDDADDVLAYAAALKHFRKRLASIPGLLGKYDPWDDREWLQMKTYGSVALLHKWLVKAAGRAARRRGELTQDDLTKTYGSVVSAPDEYQEALKIGEARFGLLRESWGRSPARSKGDDARTRDEDAPRSDAERATTPRRPRPFQGSLKPVAVGAGRRRNAASA